MTIRAANVADAEALAQVHVASWQAAFRGIMPDRVLDCLSTARFRESWQRLFQNEQPVTIVAEIDEQIRAFATFGPSRDKDTDQTTTAELYGLYVHPVYWKRGLGTALCDRVLCEMRSQQVHMVNLWVLAANTRARGFYNRLGFLPEPEQYRRYRRYKLNLAEIRYRQSLR